jgi:hypothetical protein
VHRKKRLLLVGMTTTLAGTLASCAPLYVPPVGLTHPASASAPETPPPPPSQTLAGDLAAYGAETGQSAAGSSEMHGTKGGH